MKQLAYCSLKYEYSKKKLIVLLNTNIQKKKKYYSKKKKNYFSKKILIKLTIVYLGLFGNFIKMLKGRNVEQ